LVLTLPEMAPVTTARDQEMPEPLSRRLNVAQAADYTGLAKSTLNKYRGTGVGPKFIRPGGARRVVYDSFDLDAWLDQHKRCSTSDDQGVSDAPQKRKPGGASPRQPGPRR
jgi:predicted DNA-binding transcriptional regulator AlpA